MHEQAPGPIFARFVKKRAIQLKHPKSSVANRPAVTCV